MREWSFSNPKGLIDKYDDDQWLPASAQRRQPGIMYLLIEVQIITYGAVLQNKK